MKDTRREFEELAWKFADEELSPGELNVLRRHLRDDRKRRFFRETLALSGLLALRYESEADVASVLQIARHGKPRPAECVDDAGAWEPAALTSGWRALRLAGISAAAAILALVGAWMWNASLGSRGGESEWVARVEKVSGVGFQGSGPDRTLLKNGDELRGGARIETGRDGVVNLARANEATFLQLDGDAALTLGLAAAGQAKVGHSTIAFLARGRLTASVAQQAPGKRFAIETPHATATVLGTQFGLTVNSNTTRLDVVDGLVQLTRRLDGSSINVAAGGYALAVGQRSESSVGTNAVLEVVYEDEFDGDGLDRFWTVVDPAGQVAVNPPGHKSKLVLTAAGKDFNLRNGTAYPAVVGIISSPIAYRDGEILELIVEYNGNAVVTLADEAGQPLSGELLRKDEGVGELHDPGSGRMQALNVGIRGEGRRRTDYIYRANRVLTLFNGKAILGAPNKALHAVRIHMELASRESLFKEDSHVERVSVRRLRALPPDIEARIHALTSLPSKAE